MIAIGSDHAGYELKKEIIDYLTRKGYEVKDFGTDSRKHPWITRILDFL